MVYLACHVYPHAWYAIMVPWYAIMCPGMPWYTLMHCHDILWGTMLWDGMSWLKW